MKQYLNNDLIIKRYPIRKSDLFQGWNAADEHILKYMLENNLKPNNMLIIEDDFGVLALNSEAKNKFLINDSIVNQLGIEENFKNNRKPLDNVKFLNPFEKLPDDIDLVLIKIPKSNQYLEHLINILNINLNDKTPIIAGGMIKYLNKTIYSMFDKNCLDVSSSLGWKKSRLIICKTNSNNSEKMEFNEYQEFGIRVVNYPNLFSYNKLDIGTRFLLENIESFEKKHEVIVDLGCANGIIGIFIGLKNPDSKLVFSDINHSAIKSAKESCRVNNILQRSEFYCCNCLNNLPDKSADLILCNPPFHDQHKISTLTSFEMFKDSQRVLRKNGELIVVGNRHLGYKNILSKMFYRTYYIKRSNKFDLIKAIR